MKQITSKTTSLLSTLWIFLLLNIFAMDIHEFTRQGYIQKLMGRSISEGIMLLAAIMIEIPILMVLLSRVLPYQINRWANVAAALLDIVLIVAFIDAPDLDNIFFTAVQILALVTIVTIALRWKLGEEAK